MSQKRLTSCISLPLDHKILVNAVETAKDWALTHGIGVRDKNCYSKDKIQFMPIALLPSSFPRTVFEKAAALQPLLNELMYKVAQDDDFLISTLGNTLKMDEFHANIYDIWMKVQKERIAQPISICIVRSDIMLDSQGEHTENLCAKNTPYSSWKQVEINTYAQSGAPIATSLTGLHSYILQQLGHDDLIKNIPENHAVSGLCDGLIEAFDLFGVPSAVVVFVTVCDPINICDLRSLEFEIHKTRPDITIYRLTLTEIFDETKLDDKKQLFADGRLVGLVYYLSGYDPSHYPSYKEWEARHRLERSTAIKCPPISYYLAGTKKVQQALAAPGVLEKFMGVGPDASRVRDIFTGLYSLDLDEQGDKAAEMALADVDRFVMKPQREGGSYNIYGEDIRHALLRMRQSDERAAYILMDRIVPPSVPGYMIAPGVPFPPPIVDLVPEIGMFGVIISNKDKITRNEQIGYLLRSKLANVNEGRVLSGYGVFDTPYLIDN